MCSNKEIVETENKEQIELRNLKHEVDILKVKVHDIQDSNANLEKLVEKLIYNKVLPIQKDNS